jgi:virulence factor Mce-like protein
VKRVIAILVMFTLVFAAMAALLLTGGKSGYKVDAIFDDVDFLIPGQDVRIAGATAGTVETIKLTSDRKARVEMRIDPKYGQFHADADCTIEPQSLIGDRFVNCTPGTPAAPVLKAEDGEPPTLAVANTHSPVDLDLVLQTLDLPVRQRAAILLDSLGVGLAARGADLNQTILRANPALQETRQVLGILNDNKAQLQSLISASDIVLGHLAQSRSRVGQFIRNSATVLNTTAEHRTALAADFQRLPALLAQARPTLSELTDFARQGTPVATELQQAAPSFSDLLAQLQSFAPKVLPTVKKLGTTATTLQRALPFLTPQVLRLKTFSSVAVPSGKLIADLFSSLKNEGAADGLLEFTYYAAAAFARYDTISHILPAYAMVTDCEISPLGSTPTPGCDAHLSSASASTAAAAHARRHRSSHATTGRSVHARTGTPSKATGVAPAPTAAAPTGSAPVATPAAPTAPAAPASTPAPAPSDGGAISGLLKFLLG